MINPDLLRWNPLVYRTTHKRWVMLAPYVSGVFWLGTLCLLAVTLYLSPVQITLP